MTDDRKEGRRRRRKADPLGKVAPKQTPVAGGGKGGKGGKNRADPAAKPGPSQGRVRLTPNQPQPGGVYQSGSRPQILPPPPPPPPPLPPAPPDRKSVV